MKIPKLKTVLFFSFLFPVIIFTGCQTKKINIYEADNFFFSGIVSGHLQESRFKAKFKWSIGKVDKIIILSNFGNVLADIQINKNSEVLLRLKGEKHKYLNFALMTKEIIGVEVPYDLLVTSILNKKKNYVKKYGNLKIQKQNFENSQNLNIKLSTDNAVLKILFIDFYD